MDSLTNERLLLDVRGPFVTSNRQVARSVTRELQSMNSLSPPTVQEIEATIDALATHMRYEQETEFLRQTVNPANYWTGRKHHLTSASIERFDPAAMYELKGKIQEAQFLIPDGWWVASRGMGFRVRDFLREEPFTWVSGVRDSVLDEYWGGLWMSRQPVKRPYHIHIETCGHRNWTLDRFIHPGDRNKEIMALKVEYRVKVEDPKRAFLIYT